MGQSSRYDGNCRSCQAIQGTISLTNAPRILETPSWVVEHVHPTPLEGYLVLVLNRHCSAIHELQDEEMLEFGKLLSLLCKALHDILNTDKEYVLQFAETEGFHHVHFHVIARLAEWPDSQKGGRVSSAQGEPISSEVATRIALGVREYLLNHSELQ